MRTMTVMLLNVKRNDIDYFRLRHYTHGFIKQNDKKIY